MVFVNFLNSVENKVEVDCFVNRMFLSLDNPFDSDKDNTKFCQLLSLALHVKNFWYILSLIFCSRIFLVIPGGNWTKKFSAL